ncbi:hypothetical protein [Pannonibacter phragmitetus]|uniref:hypothetical protein n=1 Tax=Pannonibacter phragmitetus TaxID=121719 RepID=UPI000F45A2F3|nr:hypothetical protein [Pannonibacter phragmitetus]
MRKHLAISAVALITVTSNAFATGALSDAASPATKIIQGHGQPGETATSNSNPDVSVRVLENGNVERTNSRFGTVTIIDPKAEHLKIHRSR